jgi:lipopolysaccharide/colanic/teichoic acid biosynthesis glycosyltransferase
MVPMEERLISASGAALSGPVNARETPPATAPTVRPAAPATEPAAPLCASERGVSGEVIGFGEFMHQLHREKRRAERSRTPLSLAMFHLADRNQRGTLQVERLLESLCAVKRETDVVGHAGDAQVAVLCPDTDEAGDLPFVMSVATFPDDLFDSLAQGIEVPKVFEPFIATETADHQAGYALKRTLDVVGALFALIVLSPVMLAVALAVGLGSRGPIIFRQSRVGKGGVPFTFYKFRSMVTGGNDAIHREFVANLIKTAAEPTPASDDEPVLYKIKADPRVTRVGRFIRRTSLDELPQLFNVLKGEMSLVGPRPPLPYELAQYQPWHLRRILALKPGITGLWQVEGRSRVSFNEMVRMDLRYIRECSLATDLSLLVRTVRVVLHCEGAV